MILELWAIGKSRENWLQAGIEIYTKRLPHLIPFKYEEWPGPRLPPKPSPAQIVEAEAEYIGSRIKNSDQLHLLDEGGRSFTSRDFATHLEKLQHQGGSRIIFHIGGAYGFGESLYARANGKIALSEMTLSHQLVRVVALEQLYRAMSILRNLPYHND